MRVGGDPGRKLSADDRLIGSSSLALDQGITPAYIAVGAAAGIRRYLSENGGQQSMDSAKSVLWEVSHLEVKHPLSALILHYYEMLLNGCDLQKLVTEAEIIKHKSMPKVV